MLEGKDHAEQDQRECCDPFDSLAESFADPGTQRTRPRPGSLVGGSMCTSRVPKRSPCSTPGGARKTTAAGPQPIQMAARATSPELRPLPFRDHFDAAVEDLDSCLFVDGVGRD